MPRQYNFELPYTVSGMKVSMGRSQLTGVPGYERIPADLQQKVANAGWGTDLVITKQDLDRIPDDVWANIAQKLGLSYSGSAAPVKKPSKAPAKAPPKKK